MVSNPVAVPKPLGLNLSFKPSKAAVLLLGAGILVVVVIALMVIRNQQTAEQQSLNLQLTGVKARLSALKLDQLTSQQSTLLQQNDQAVQQLASIKQLIATPMNSIDGSDKLYSIAAECGVTIVNLAASQDTKDKLGGVDATVMPISITVNGDWLKLVDYIARLKTDFTKCLVESADITVSVDPAKNASSADTAPVDPAQNPSSDTTASVAPVKSPSSANIKLSIYTYRGN